METRKCHSYGREARVARNCTKKVADSQERAPKQERTQRRSVKCYHCGKVGHIAMQCPDTALVCGGAFGKIATCTGVVEGRVLEGILLDTGCSRTMVRSELVPEGSY